MSVKITPYSVRYKLEDDDESNEYLAFYDTFNQLMYNVSKMYAFNDCCPIDIIKIKADGKEVRYLGWEPGMVMRYIYKGTSEVCYENCFPEWDH